MIHRALVAVAAAALVLAGRPLEEAADAAAPSPGASRAWAPRPACRPGAVLVRLTEDVPPAKVRAALPAGARLGARLGAGVYDVGVPVGREAVWAAGLAAVPGVAWAQIDHRARAIKAGGSDLEAEGRQVTAAGRVRPVLPFPPVGGSGRGMRGKPNAPIEATPNDPLFPEQWALEEIGMPAA